MSKDISVELRRVGRGRDRRVRSGNLQSLRELRGTDRAEVRQSHHRQGKENPVRRARTASARVNWKVQIQAGQVVAIEPNREFEHVFEGGSDDYWAAVEYAAKQLREGDEQ